MKFRVLFFLFLYSINLSCLAAVYVLPSNGDVVGDTTQVTVKVGETLSDIGIRYDIGYYEMLLANPQLDPVRPLPLQAKVIIPSQFILPPGPRQGIVINLAEYRLYFFPPNTHKVVTVPVGIGREGWNTPVGITKVIMKEQDPIWRPTENVRAEAAKNGTPIPMQFPPGNGNPLGRHILRLGWPTYLIHGTNRKDGVGSRVSAGCIRLMPEDIASLYDQIPVGTSVRVINEPLKIGRANGQLLIEIHSPLMEQGRRALSDAVQQLIPHYANNPQVKQELLYPSGIPKRITA